MQIPTRQMRTPFATLLTRAMQHACRSDGGEPRRVGNLGGGARHMYEPLQWPSEPVTHCTFDVHHGPYAHGDQVSILLKPYRFRVSSFG
jgi:hypothetical protein